MRHVCFLTSKDHHRENLYTCVFIRQGEEAAELEDENVELNLDPVTPDNSVIDAIHVRRLHARRLPQEEFEAIPLERVVAVVELVEWEWNNGFME
jgi:hypothetical protein